MMGSTIVSEKQFKVKFELGNSANSNKKLHRFKCWQLNSLYTECSGGNKFKMTLKTANYFNSAVFFSGHSTV